VTPEEFKIEWQKMMEENAKWRRETMVPIYQAQIISACMESDIGRKALSQAVAKRLLGEK
jgi:hypothetical protein